MTTAARQLPYTFWPLRIALARFRPFNAALITKAVLVGTLFIFFLLGDYLLFRRVFKLTLQIESATPFFALGLIQNLLGMVFLISFGVLFFSSLTAAIGAFFADADLEIYHAGPAAKVRIVMGRWIKTAIQSSYLVVAFLIPLFWALADTYQLNAPLFAAQSTLRLMLMLAAPISLACAVIILLVRFFPLRRVHQIAVMLAVIALTISVVGFRMARPERLFQNIDTDDLATVLQSIELPSSNSYPSSWLAESVVAFSEGRNPVDSTRSLILLATLSALLFLAVALPLYFRAFVRARESLAPVAIGAGGVTSMIDRLTRRLDPQAGAMVRKEIRIVTRDAAQWSQMLMMLALLFIYLYNIQVMPLEGDLRATLLAYLNVGMSGFVISAIALRFAYPSVSGEGKAFWNLRTAPISYRRFLWIKVLVYLVPLLGLSVVLTVLANIILAAPPTVWYYTVGGGALVTSTIIALGVGMGGYAPNFSSENPLEVGLSLGGFGFMASSMLYVGIMMVLMGRPLHRFIFHRLFGVMDGSSFVVIAAPVGMAILLSAALSVIPIELANRRISRAEEN